MRSYTGIGSATTGTNLSITTLVGATSVRAAIFQLITGSAAAPADAVVRLELRRFTAAGTAGSSPSAIQADTVDASAQASVGSGDFSVEPTYASSSFAIPQNQRATVITNFHPGREWKCPASSSNGLGIQSRATSGGTPIFYGTIAWEE